MASVLKFNLILSQYKMKFRFLLFVLTHYFFQYWFVVLLRISKCEI